MHHNNQSITVPQDLCEKTKNWETLLHNSYPDLDEDERQELIDTIYSAVGDGKGVRCLLHSIDHEWALNGGMGLDEIAVAAEERFIDVFQNPREFVLEYLMDSMQSCEIPAHMERFVDYDAYADSFELGQDFDIYVMNELGNDKYPPNTNHTLVFWRY